ncbi:MAG: hypothetical protein ABJN26_00185 [Stappiaceae bacterium]
MEKISVPYFDGLEVDLELETDSHEVREILKRFCELGEENRLQDSRHVYAYYRDYRAAVGGEDWLDEEMGVPEKPEDIWRFVTPGSVHITRGHDPDKALYVEMDAACGWEEEHGLMLVWKNG